MRRFLTLVTLVNVFSLSVCQAAETGTVRLQGLQDNSLVYVDGKPVKVKNGALELPVGTHQLQVEQFRSPQEIQFEPQGIRNLTGVYVFRSCLVLKNTQTLTISLKPLPVYPTAAATVHSSWSSMTAPGPMGPMGRPGATADKTQEMSLETAYSLLQEAILGEFSDVWVQLRYAQVERPSAGSFGSRARNHWYGPVTRLTKVNYLICAPGPAGRQGPIGLSGNLLRLQDAHGRSILQNARDAINLGQWKSEIHQIHQANRSNYRPLHIEDVLKPVSLYTERWKNHLDGEFARFSFASASQKPVSIGLEPGPMGPNGPRGPDGKVPTPNTAIVLPEEQTKELLMRLQADPQIQQQITQVQESIRRLKEPMKMNPESDCINAN